MITIALAVAVTSQAKVEQHLEAVQQVVKQAKRKLRIGADGGGRNDRVGHTRGKQLCSSCARNLDGA